MPKYKHETGYFLIITLVFIHIFSLITLYVFSQLADEMRYVNKLWQASMDDLLAKEAMQIIEKTLAKVKKNCIIAEEASADIKKHARSWWEQKGCKIVIRNDVYWYLLEKIQHDACAFSVIQNKLVTGVTYYRISVLKQYSHSIIQAITAVVDHKQSTCQASLRSRELGRQSWRIL